MLAGKFAFRAPPWRGLVSGGFEIETPGSIKSTSPFTMKATDSPPSASPGKRRGVALVVVMAFLVLVTFLVLAFFSSVTTDLAASKSYSDGASAKGLSDSAVSAVMGIIRQATSGGPNVAWTSQPGMLRTYDVAGQSLQAYKLYSSDKMVVPGFDPADDVDTAWKEKPGLYTDLNMPISSSNSSSVLHYPIVDPAAADPNSGVEGFSLINAPGYSKSKPAAPANNPAPMPVKWIYLLRDGTMTAPDSYSTTTGIATFTTGPIPTKANPIVGRMAFWTDDETAKVNINTASEGTYWDTPRVATQEDYGSYVDTTLTGMATYQPAQKEYQRYPGHPSTTCLSSVLGSIFGVSSPYPISANSSDAALLDPYYAIVPRIGQADGTSGGSRGGTAVAPGVVTVENDRLYATVDELVFNPLRKPNVESASKITSEKLEKVRFFLTASSSAPETTIFNTPRISIWPVWLDATKRTVSDKLLAFCSTVGGKNYYFTRSNAKSSTEDFSARNAVLYKYLQSLTSKKIPGFGGDFQTKLGADRDQVLTSIYDYIRCTNLSDSSAGAYPYTPQFNASAVTTDASTANYAIGAGQVVPIQITSGTTTRGYGRMHTISGAALVFYATGVDANNRVNRMQSVFLVQFACPMHGAAGMMPNMKLVIPLKAGEGLNLFQAKGKTSPAFKPLGFPQGGTNFIENADVSTWAGRSVGGVESPAMAITTTWSNKGATGKKSTRVSHRALLESPRKEYIPL
jgi:uncharacterized protein (TIGR02600 family)